jgi:hypothetical protein
MHRTRQRHYVADEPQSQIGTIVRLDTLTANRVQNIRLDLGRSERVVAGRQAPRDPPDARNAADAADRMMWIGSSSNGPTNASMDVVQIQGCSLDI